MYDFIIGNLTRTSESAVVLENQGIGYEVQVPQSLSLPEIGETKLYIHEHLSENEHALYGFPSRLGRNLFRLLIGVSGVGPKMAIRVFDQFSPEEVIRILGSKNAGEFRKVKGLGIKTAEKIIIELHKKGKEMMLSLSLTDTAPHTSAEEEAVSALVGLGYKELAVRGMVVQIAAQLREEGDPQAATVIKKALEKLSKLN